MPANYVDPYFKELFGGKTPQQVAAEITAEMPTAIQYVDADYMPFYAPYASKESIEKVINTVASTPGASKKLFNFKTFGFTNKDTPYDTNMAFSDENGQLMVDYGLMTSVANQINKRGEKGFIEANIPDIVFGYSGGYGGNLQDFIDALPQAGFTQEDVPNLQAGFNQGQAEARYIASISTPFEIKHGFGSMVQGLASNPLAPILMSLALPAAGASLGAALGTSAAVGTALAATGMQVAQGVPFEDALKNSIVNAVIQTGSPSVATEINNQIKIPAVSDAITSAGASALKTAAAGGSAADIERNMVGAIAGSATASAVEAGTEGNISAGRLAGATVGGAAIGGTAGALTGLAGEYAGQKAAEQAKLEAQKGTKLAAADGSTMSDSASLAPVVVTGKAEPSITDTSIIISGTPIFADSPRAANVKPPTGFTVMPIQLAENKPAGSYYDIEQNAWLTPTQPVTPAPVAEPSLPTTTVTGKAESGITDTSIITPTGPISDREVMGAMQPSVPTPAPSPPSLREVEVKAKRELGETSILSPDPSLSTVTVKGEREIDSLPGVTVKGEREVDDTLSEVTVKGKQEEEPIAEEPTVDEKGKPYRPNLFIYGGTTPSTLTQTLRTNLPTASTTTGTSVGLGGRGEIESKESGKKRQTVWNEESLRLKDALGL